MRWRLRSSMVVIALIAVSFGIATYVKRSLSFQNLAKDHEEAAFIRQEHAAGLLESADSWRSEAEDSRKETVKSMEEFKASIRAEMREDDDKDTIAADRKAIAEAESRGLAILKAKDIEFSRNMAYYAYVVEAQTQVAAYHRRMARRYRVASWRPWQGVYLEPVPGILDPNAPIR